jgi:DNA-directed RNA polymerase sigma subunit (sigma70/sigma32)
MEEKIKELSEREKKVIRERLGLNGNSGKSRSEVSKMFATSEETIQRVEDKAKEILSK